MFSERQRMEAQVYSRLIIFPYFDIGGSSQRYERFVNLHDLAKGASVFSPRNAIGISGNEHAFRSPDDCQRSCKASTAEKKRDEQHFTVHELIEATDDHPRVAHSSPPLA